MRTSVETPEKGRTQGVALVVTLAIMLVVGLLVLASAVTGLIDRSISANQLRSNAAYYTALGGIETYKTAVFRNLVDFYGENGAGWCESPIEGGLEDDAGNPLLAYDADNNRWITSESQGFGQGSFDIVLEIVDGFLVLTSVGQVADATSTVQLVASAGGGPGSAWDNAILAQGAEAGSKAINGNVAVYGSVHIVEGSLDGTLAIGGTSGIYNTYYGEGGSNSDITTAVDSIVNTDVDLCSRVKIADGDIYLESGSVQIGTSADPVYSVHLGNGIVCDAKETGGGCKANKEVSDHTANSGINLRYPEDSGINSPYTPYDIDLPRVQQSAFDDAFKTAALLDGVWTPPADCAWLYDASGDVVLPPAIAGDSARCGDAEGNYIEWSSGTLLVGGDVNIPNASLTVTSNVEYRGNGSLYVGENLDDTSVDINIDKGSLKPADSLTYLENPGNALALLTSGDINYESTASLDPSAVLMYAHGTFNALKQPVIVGAVVAEAFDLGNQVPKIAYHPNVRFAAERLCLPGTACAGDGAPQNPGVLADIAIERR